jgi:hypothetical protein
MVVRYVVPSSIALVLAWAVTPATAAIVETYGDPGVENASSVVVTNANTLGVENFDSLPMGSSGFTTNYGTGGLITGVYSAGADIVPANIFGGAGGIGQYVDAIRDTTGYTIKLSTSGSVSGVNYFGYWLSALDPGNQIVFKEGGTRIATSSPADVIAAIGPCASSNTGPGPNGYCGNPFPGFGYNNQQYAFVNFVDTTGFFDEIDVFESPAVGNYESDNHTVAFCRIPEHASLAILLTPPSLRLGLVAAGLHGSRLCRL